MARRRVLAALAALVLAVVGAGLLIAWVSSAEDRALEGLELVEVYIVQEAIPAGTPVERFGERVALEEIQRSVLADGAITDLEPVADLLTAVALVPGEQLLDSRLTADDPRQVGVPAPPGMLEVSVQLDLERSVGGIIEAGDTVAVVASFEPFDITGTPVLPGEDLDNLDADGPTFTVIDGNIVVNEEQTPNATHILLHKALVTNVQLLVDDLPETTTDDEETGEAEGSEFDFDRSEVVPTSEVIVTLALTAPEVERFVFTAEFGTLWLALEPSSASEDNTRIQNRGTIFVPIEIGGS